MSSDGGPGLLRRVTWPLGLVYRAVAAVRNRTFDAGLRAVHRVTVPVVSIGNLTVGGTGKTPTVAYVCELARSRGKRPGVVARGYGRAPGALLNDEGAMLQRRFPWLLQQQDPDRVAGARRLVEAGADFVVMDDGFQHRRLHRDLDVVCVDAAQPFGNGSCLPTGDLREGPAGLRRAGVVLLTRAARLDANRLGTSVATVRRFVRDGVGVHACDHAAKDFVAQPTGTVVDLAAMRGRRAWLLSGIARPASFRAAIESIGVVVAGEHRHRDHHRFTADEVAAAARAATAADAVLVVTEKDDARLAEFAIERHVLRIELRFLHDPPPPATFLL